ncbi:MAG: hypothetical protein ACE14O_04625 [Candidatus Cloacimonadaceae bacterium]
MNQSIGSVERMSVKETFAAVNNLKRQLEENFLQLGELLSLIKRQKLYAKKGYATFKECAENEFKLSSAMANKLCSVYDLYIDNLDLDEQTAQEIGFDRLNLVKPYVAKADTITQDEWLEKAEQMPLGELKEHIKQLKDKEKATDKTLKDVLVDQYLERMCAEFNCSRQELNFKLALYFQDADLDAVKKEIKIRQRRFEAETQTAKEEN